MTQVFSTFDAAINHADTLCLGEPSHPKPHMLAAFATCHDRGEYSKRDLYTVSRRLRSDYGVEYVLTIHA